MKAGPLELLISLDPKMTSEERRTALRDVTDRFIVASDRYGRRDMATFDLLLSRTANVLDHRLRKLIVMTLIRAGARDEHVKTTLTSIRSPNERFLRRSVTQTSSDILSFLIENAEAPEIPEGLSDLDGNSIELSSAIRFWLFHYLLTTYREAMVNRIGHDRIDLMVRTCHRFQQQLITASTEAATEEITVARRTVKEWARQKAITEEVLIELLEARAMTEFLMASAQMLDLDVATVIRSMNDRSFHCLAIIMKSKGIRRAGFAKIITGFRHRRSDDLELTEVLKLYDRLPPEAAERAMRFLQVRISDLSAETNSAKALAAG